MSQERGVAFSIRFAGGTNQFHVGEIIPIELSFSAPAPNTYDIESRNYDRSGRLNIEQFHVNPQGRDPLLTYFSEGSFFGGGLGGPRPLNTEPHIIGDDLNEWVALDQPGHYTVYVTTERVSRRTSGKNAPVELRSNTLEFEIVAAEAAWQQRTFSSAISVLNNGSTKEEEKIVAIRVLRFLDTPESIRALVRQFDALPSGRGFDCIAGLSGSRYPNLVVHELEQQMSAPDTAITPEYIYTFAKLKFQSEHSPLPPYPQNDTEQQKAWAAQMQERQKSLARLEESLYADAANLVPSKQGRARAETVRTLLVRPTRGSEDFRPLTSVPETDVTASFLALSPDQQYDVLSIFWERLRAPAMIAPLESIVRKPEVRHHLLRDIALQRLYELAPQEATPLILAEIKQPHIDNGRFTVSANTLGVLHNETLPEFDDLLAARIEQRLSLTFPLDAQLVARYATRAVLPRVKAAYVAKPGLEGCVSEDGFISYFLRTDADYGVRLLAAEPSVCMTKSIPAVIRMKRWNEVQPAVIGHMNNPDLNRARQAAETLAKYGDAEAEKAMWERLRSFHQQWAGRENELLALRAGASREASDAMGFQYGLVESLAKAQNWILSDEEVTQLENLTLGSERENIKHWYWISPVEISVTILPNQDLHIDINHQYFSRDVATFAAKLRQYPEGTRFRLTPFGPQSRLTTVLEQINQVASLYGLSVEILPAIASN
ncbi:MAG: hypothetical protein ACJ71Q_20300 [Terriglobales bacterium]